MGHDLTSAVEHAEYEGMASAMYNQMTMEQLRELEARISEKMDETSKYPTAFHIAVKDAISKKIMDTLPPLHCTCVFALYKEQNRILPQGKEGMPGVHPNGENFIRMKHQQMSWLFENRPDCSWSLLGADDGCANLSSDIMEGIAKQMGYTNVSCVRLKEAVKAGSCPVLDNDKLKSEEWNEDDKLVKASQKGGAIIYALHCACEKEYPGKKHIVAYTDSDLSSDLRLCGLNFDTIINGNVDCSVSQRFGQPFAVNCSMRLESGGVGPGLARDSIIHLTLRHKLRMNLLPPLSVVIDTNCGHKAFAAEAVKDILSHVRDYKASFDMDLLMCLGINSKAKGRTAIGVTAIPWVASIAESAFWTAPSGEVEDEAAKKLKACTSWFKIFAALTMMNDWHKEGLEKQGFMTEEAKQYVEWVKSLDVQAYMKLVDKISAELGSKELAAVPDETIMGYDLATLKSFCA
eukprot:SRR837773.23727.p1 GENE.SRR837773.23727~~SRR837773.23727.p1  ORF type:complete len:476 (-),score=181.20 SRR837773.23727:173-1558(-)